MATFQSADALRAAVGQSFGPTDWLVVEQSRIDAFASTTGDDQWIHVDVERAKSGPYGGTIAHGYLILSLVNLFLPDLVSVPNAKMGINYGVDRLRFPGVVRAGARIRAHAEMVSVEDVTDGVQVKVRVSIEVEGASKPACVVDTLSRFYF
jgi:acyl dehydratase